MKKLVAALLALIMLLPIATAEETIPFSGTDSNKVISESVSTEQNVEDESTPEDISAEQVDPVVEEVVIDLGDEDELSTDVPANEPDVTLESEILFHNEAASECDDMESIKTSFDIAGDDITVTAIADQIYTGAAITPEITIRRGTTILQRETDFTVSYEDNTEIGTATVIINGSGSYTGERRLSFNILEALLKVSKNCNAAVNLGSILQIQVENKDIKTCASSNKKIVSVSKTGLLNAKKAGSAKITVTTTDKKKVVIKLKVVDPSMPTKLSLDHTGTVKMNLQDTLQLDYTITPATATSTVTWKSSNPKIAAIDKTTGLLTPKKDGTVTITATTARGKKTAKVKVKIVDPYKPTGISFAEGKSGKTDKIDYPLQLTPVLKPEGAQSAITWKSSNAKIATVDANGVVTPRKKGKVTITATTYNKKKASFKLTVTDTYGENATMHLNDSEVIIGTNDTYRLNGYYDTYNQGRTSFTERNVSWSSSDESIATVDKSGLVTAISIGNATITAHSKNDIFGHISIIINVVDPSKPVRMSFKEGTSRNVREGLDSSVFDLHVEVLPRTAQPTLTWHSSNESVATVDENGHVTMRYTFGSCTITATAENGVYCRFNVMLQVGKYLDSLLGMNIHSVNAYMPQRLIQASSTSYTNSYCGVKVDSNGRITFVALLSSSSDPDYTICGIYPGMTKASAISLLSRYSRLSNTMWRSGNKYIMLTYDGVYVNNVAIGY